MFTVPLAFTGGFLGLYITGSEVSVIALIGFVMLSGIIVNNGIVLVDYINQLREAGMEKTEAIISLSMLLKMNSIACVKSFNSFRFFIICLQIKSISWYSAMIWALKWESRWRL